MTEQRKNRLVVAVVGGLVLALSLWCWLKPETASSDSERRTLASFPELNWESVSSGAFMEEFETYAMDQFPLRDGFRRLKALAAFYGFRKGDEGGLYCAEGHVSRLDPVLQEPMLAHGAERFQFLYETYLAGTAANCYLAIVPDKNFYLARPNGYPALDYDALWDTMEGLTPFLTPIDLRERLSLEDYYRTDTHWRQERLLPVARYLGAEMGVTLTEEYRSVTLDSPFYGVYRGQSALPLEPDSLTYLTSDLLEGYTVTSYATGTAASAPLYDLNKAGGRDPYELFLSGAQPLLVIENPNAATGRELVLFRDSFGSSLAPLLAEGYRTVTVVDIRYLRSEAVGNYVDFEGKDVLFLYSTLLLNSSLALN